MTQSDNEAFHPIRPSVEIADGFVVPHYFAERRQRIALARVAGRFYAFDDLCLCAQERCALSAGLLTGTTIMCQCHGSRFDIATGAVIEGPATDNLNTYEAREQDGVVVVRLGPSQDERP